MSRAHTAPFKRLCCRKPSAWPVGRSREISAGIQDAFDACVQAGCEVVICHPFFLGPGRHVLDDVPALLEAANASPKLNPKKTAPSRLATRTSGPCSRRRAPQRPSEGRLRQLGLPRSLGSSPLILDLLHDSISGAVEQEDQAAPDFESSFFGAIQAAIAADGQQQQQQQ